MRRSRPAGLDCRSQRAERINDTSFFSTPLQEQKKYIKTKLKIFAYLYIYCPQKVILVKQHLIFLTLVFYTLIISLARRESIFLKISRSLLCLILQRYSLIMGSYFTLQIYCAHIQRTRFKQVRCASLVKKKIYLNTFTRKKVVDDV